MLLAIDTSTAWISLALYDGNFIQYEATWQAQHHHTVALAPALAEMFQKTGLKGEDLTGLAVALGPGSFTSLRIGLAAAKGLALGLNIPMVGVSSLDIVAVAQPLDEKPMIVVLHAGRSRLAYATYEAVDHAWKAVSEPAVIDPKDLVKLIKNPTLICGELSGIDRSIIGRRWKNAVISSPANCLRRAGYLAELGWERLDNNQPDDPVTLGPIYLSTIDNPLPA